MKWFVTILLISVSLPAGGCGSQLPGAGEPCSYSWDGEGFDGSQACASGLDCLVMGASLPSGELASTSLCTTKCDGDDMCQELFPGGTCHDGGCIPPWAGLGEACRSDLDSASESDLPCHPFFSCLLKSHRELDGSLHQETYCTVLCSTEQDCALLGEGDWTCDTKANACIKQDAS